MIKFLKLMDICLRPLAFRPPYIGGNRLGFLLMELRREFILSGVFPHQLPEMTQKFICKYFIHLEAIFKR